MAKRGHLFIPGQESAKPSAVHQLIQKAQAFLAKGDKDAAEEYCVKALELGYEKTHSYFALGVVYREAGHQGLALNAFLNAIDEKEDNVHALVGAAGIYVGKGDFQRAKRLLDQCLEHTKTFAEAYQVLGQCLVSEVRYEEGIAALERANSLSPSNSNILTNLASAYMMRGNPERSLEYSEKAYKASPKDPLAILNLANVYLILGRREDVEKLARRAIKLAPDDPKTGPAYITLARCKKWRKEDHHDILSLEQKLDASLPLGNRIKIHFALAKIYDDCGEADKAFHHANLGNRLSNVDYSLQEAKNLHKSLKKTGDTSFCRSNMEIDGVQHESPIFVIGFPRSGSTLLEQILDTSEHVVSVGENGALMDVIRALDLPRDEKRYGANLVDKLSLMDPAEVASAYYERVEPFAFGQELMENSRYLDKTLGNFLYLGVISRIFPGVKIIHTLRSPLDSCLSNYFQDYMRDISFSYNLEHLGRYYVIYRQLMEFWEEVLPVDILTVQYEEMVADPEVQSKRVFEFCELEWTPVCLEYYKLSKPVNTASNVQVREPVYQRSVRRWHKYANHLLPVAKAVRDYLSEEDLAYYGDLGIKLKRRGFFPF